MDCRRERDINRLCNNINNEVGLIKFIVVIIIVVIREIVVAAVGIVVAMVALAGTGMQ